VNKLWIALLAAAFAAAPVYAADKKEEKPAAEANKEVKKEEQKEVKKEEQKEEKKETAKKKKPKGGC